LKKHLPTSYLEEPIAIELNGHRDNIYRIYIATLRVIKATFNHLAPNLHITKAFEKTSTIWKIDLIENIGVKQCLGAED
jgi:hypothetical protein